MQKMIGFLSEARMHSRAGGKDTGGGGTWWMKGERALASEGRRKSEIFTAAEDVPSSAGFVCCRHYLAATPSHLARLLSMLSQASVGISVNYRLDYYLASNLAHVTRDGLATEYDFRQVR